MKLLIALLFALAPLTAVAHPYHYWHPGHPGWHPGWYPGWHHHGYWAHHQRWDGQHWIFVPIWIDED